MEALAIIRLKRHIEGMWKPRLESASIMNDSKQFPALVLTGARQTGKTSLLRQTFPNHRYVSLDLVEDARLAESSPDAFLRSFPPPVIVDEVQYAPQLFRHLKVAIDRQRERMGQFVLTGSQKFSLMKEVADSLAGRVAIRELETLSLREAFDQDPIDLVRYLVRGGYPELWNHPEMSSTRFFTSYVMTYLERDVRQILNVTNLRDFDRFLRLCAARNAQLVNRAELAKDVGVAASTIGQWLSVLEASNIVTQLEPWFTNVGKRIVRTPKLYFNDVGLVCHLLALNEETVQSSPFVGALWETLVFAELRKRNAGRATPIFFYRDQQGREVDFLLQKGDGLHCYEAKWTEIPEPRDARSMDIVSALFKTSGSPFRIASQSVICRTRHAHPLTETTRAISCLDMDA
jgi:uncharacterized protein